MYRLLRFRFVYVLHAFSGHSCAVSKRLKMADVVEAWLFEYACYHREYKVIEEICKRHADIVNVPDYLNVPHIRLATAVLHHAVDKNVMELFPLALGFVDDIYQVLGSVISFQVFARLSCGIKMQILFDILQRGQIDTALIKLNEYFPRMGIRNSLATSKELNRLNKCISNFRKIFLPLLANKKQRNYYFTNVYKEEYGEDYLHSLRKSAYRFVNRVDEQLPKPKIQKILEKGAHFFNGFSSSEVAYELLLDYCVNQTSLSCDNMLDILTSISPLYTQDMIYTEHNDTSLSSSNSSDLLIPSDKPVSMNIQTPDDRSFTQLKDSYEKHSLINDDSEIGGFKRKADENVPASESKRKRYRFKQGKDKEHHSRVVVDYSENVTELVEMTSRYEDHDLYINNNLQTSTSFTECDLLVRTSLEMVEKEAIEEGLLSKDDVTNGSDKTDNDSVINIDDIPITSDEENQVIQSSICPENTDSEDMLVDVSKSIKDQRKYCGLNPEIKLIYDMNLSDDDNSVYKIFT